MPTIAPNQNFLYLTDVRKRNAEASHNRLFGHTVNQDADYSKTKKFNQCNAKLNMFQADTLFEQLRFNAMAEEQRHKDTVTLTNKVIESSNQAHQDSLMLANKLDNFMKANQDRSAQ